MSKDFIHYEHYLNCTLNNIHMGWPLMEIEKLSIPAMDTGLKTILKITEILYVAISIQNSKFFITITTKNEIFTRK